MIRCRVPGWSAGKETAFRSPCLTLEHPSPPDEDGDGVGGRLAAHVTHQDGLLRHGSPPRSAVGTEHTGQLTPGSRATHAAGDRDQDYQWRPWSVSAGPG